MRRATGCEGCEGCDALWLQQQSNARPNSTHRKGRNWLARSHPLSFSTPFLRFRNRPDLPPPAPPVLRFIHSASPVQHIFCVGRAAYKHERIYLIRNKMYSTKCFKRSTGGLGWVRQQSNRKTEEKLVATGLQDEAESVALKYMQHGKSYGGGKGKMEG